MSSTTPTRLDWSTIDFAVLDMDGTLLDLHFDDQVWNVLLPRRYAKIHAIDESSARDQINARMNTRRGTLPWYCLDHWSEALGLDIGSLEAELNFLIRIRPGVQTFLEYLVDRKVRLILATNAHPESLRRKLQRTGIGKHFEDIISAHTVGAAKESAAFWQRLEKHCGIVAARTILIDDNHDVLHAARDHGIAHVYGVAQPDSHKTRVTASEFMCLKDFSDLINPVRLTQSKRINSSTST